MENNSIMKQFQSLFLVLVLVLLGLVLGLFQTEPDSKFLEFFLSLFSLGSLITLILRRLLLVGSLTFLQTHPDGFSQLRVVNFIDTSDITGTSSHENVSAQKFFAEVNFSRFDENIMAVVLMVKSRDESLDLSSLFLADIPETDQIDSDSIFL